MLKMLLGVDGSESSLHAVAHVIRRATATKEDYEVQLVNVQYPLHGDVAAFIDADQIKQYHQDEGVKALAEARAMLDKAGIAYQFHLFVGEPATLITRTARELGCDEIVIGTHGHTAIGSLLLGSVSTKIVHLAQVPVLLVK